MIKDAFREMPIVMIIMTIIVLLLLFIGVDYFGANTERFNAVVIDKHYKAEVNSVGTGYGMTPSGKGGIVTTSHHESEKFLVMVKMESGEIVTAECNATVYYGKEIGSVIECEVYLGMFTDTPWAYYGIN